MDAKKLSELIKCIVVPPATVEEWDNERESKFALVYSDPKLQIKFALTGCSTRTTTHLFASSLRFIPLEGEIKVMNQSKSLKRIMSGKTTWATWKNELALYEGEWPRNRKVQLPKWEEMFENAQDFCKLLFTEWNAGNWNLITNKDLIAS